MGQVFAFDPARMREDTSLWHTYRDLGYVGLAAVNFDGLGKEELFAAGTRGWLVLGLGPTEKLDVVLQGGSFGASTGRIARVADIEPDGRPDVIALVYSARAPYDVDLVIYDLSTGAERERQRLYTTSQLLPNDLLVANVEGGPEAEIFVVNRDDLWMLRAGEPPVWTFAGAGGTGLALGNLDHDPQPELVLATGSANTGMVLEPTLRKVEWIHTPGFGSSVTVADVDADGRAEIFATGDDGKLVRIDGVTRSPVWRGPYAHSGWQTLWADLERDGVVELLGMDGSYLWRIDPRTGEVRSLGVNWRSQTVAIDLGACQPGLVGGGWYDDLAYWSLASGLIDPAGPPTIDTIASTELAVGPLRGDGRMRLLWSHPDSDLLGVMDLHHGWGEERFWRYNIGGVLAMAQLDADPALEYAVPDATTWRVVVYDGLTHALEWETEPLYATSITALDFADVDGNGSQELVVGTGGGSLHLYDGAAGGFLWQSGYLPGALADVALADVDGVPGLEILAAVRRSGLHAFDGTTRQQKWLLSLPEISAVSVGLVSGDETPDLVIGTTSGALAVYDGATRSLLLQGSLGNVQINSLCVFDVDGDGVVEIVAAYGLGAAVVRPSDLSVVWQCPTHPGSMEAGRSMYVGDADDDTKIEILVGTGSGVAAYEYDPGTPDVQPPVWAGPIGLRSAGPSTDGCCPEVDLSWGPAHDTLSPPVTYRVYRGPAGFAPSDSTRVAETPAQSLRHRGVSPSITYEFVVRAVDRLGNEDLNEVRLAATVPAEISLIIEPAAATICPEDEVEMRVVASGGSPAGYAWYRDGGYVSGGSYPTIRASLEGIYQCFVDVGACDRRPSRTSVVTVIRKRGDVNGDCEVALPDLFFLGAYLTGQTHSIPVPVTDVDGIGTLDRKDLDRLADFLLGGAPPPAP